MLDVLWEVASAAELPWDVVPGWAVQELGPERSARTGPTAGTDGRCRDVQTRDLEGKYFVHPGGEELVVGRPWPEWSPR